jgi:tetratricopeptide (TPR) repeat protein
MRAVSAAPPPPRALELVLMGHALAVVDSPAAALPTLRGALEAFRSETLTGEDQLNGLGYASLVALNLWEDESWHVLSTRHVALARETGALTALPGALEMHAAYLITAGDFAGAQLEIDEADALAAATGSAPLTDATLLLLGWRGDEAAARPRIEAAIADAAERDEESTITLAEYASAVLYNGLGRHDAALAAARRASEHHPRGAYPKALAELVEAAVRDGDVESAAIALEQLREAPGPSATDWGLGVEARSRALLREGTAAEAFAATLAGMEAKRRP